MTRLVGAPSESASNGHQPKKTGEWLTSRLDKDVRFGYDKLVAFQSAAKQ